MDIEAVEYKARDAKCLLGGGQTYSDVRVSPLFEAFLEVAQMRRSSDTHTGPEGGDRRTTGRNIVDEEFLSINEPDEAKHNTGRRSGPKDRRQ